MGASNAGSTKGRKRKQVRDDRRKRKQTCDEAVAEHYRVAEDDFNEADLADQQQRRELILDGIDPANGEPIYSIERLFELMDALFPLTEDEYARLAPHQQRLIGTPAPMDVYTTVALAHAFDPLFEHDYGLLEQVPIPA